MMKKIMIKSAKLILDEMGLSQKGIIHKRLDQEVERRCRVYVPRKDGFLEASGAASFPETVGMISPSVSSRGQINTAASESCT